MSQKRNKQKRLSLKNLKEERKTLHSDLELALIYEELHLTSQINWATTVEGVIIDLRSLTQKQARILGQTLYAHNFMIKSLDGRFVKVVKIGALY